MKKKGTLKYYTEHTVLNPDGTKKGVFSDLRAIENDSQVDAKLYAAQLPKEKAGHKWWVVIDNHGDRITDDEYIEVGDRIVDVGWGRSAIVAMYGDYCRNAITLDGSKIFAENYHDIFPLRHRYGLGGRNCILYNLDGEVFHYRCGLGDLSTGNVILEPQYAMIKEIGDGSSGILAFREKSPSDTESFGLLKYDGKVLFKPQFRAAMSKLRWSNYNVLAVENYITIDTDDYHRYHYKILDWFGDLVYDTYSAYPYHPLLTGSDGPRAAKNAFIFFETRANWLDRGMAKLVVCDYDEDRDEVVVRSCRFRYHMRYGSSWPELSRAARRAAKIHGLQITYESSAFLGPY